MAFDRSSCERWTDILQQALDREREWLVPTVQELVELTRFCLSEPTDVHVLCGSVHSIAATASGTIHSGDHHIFWNTRTGSSYPGSESGVCMKRVQLKPGVDPSAPSLVGHVLQEERYRVLVDWHNGQHRRWEYKVNLVEYNPPIKVHSRVKHATRMHLTELMLQVEYTGKVLFIHGNKVLVLWDYGDDNVTLELLSTLTCLD